MFVLAFHRIRVRVSDPRWHKEGIQDVGLAIQSKCSGWQAKTSSTPEVFAAFTPFSRGQVPHADRIPADRMFGLFVHKLMSKHEQSRMQMVEVVHACDVQGHACRVEADIAEYPAQTVSLFRSQYLDLG